MAENVGPAKDCEKNSTDDEDVDPALLAQLLSMGMVKYLSKTALSITGNKSVEVALKWIGELGPVEMERLCNATDSSSGSTDEEDDDSEEEETFYKMVFVVNSCLKMGTGKVASQVGHAALGLYKILIKDEKYGPSLEEWECYGERKITVKGNNVEELVALQLQANQNDLPTYLVEDAGLTQIPAGTITVLAIFGDEEAVNEITGHLKLL